MHAPPQFYIETAAKLSSRFLNSHPGHPSGGNERGLSLLACCLVCCGEGMCKRQGDFSDSPEPCLTGQLFQCDGTLLAEISKHRLHPRSVQDPLHHVG